MARVDPDLAELAKLALVKLPAPPEYPRTPVGALCSIDDIAAEFARVTDHAPALNFTHPEFVRPDHGWMVAYTRWLMRLQKALRLEYKDATFDCDDYARCFVAFADLLALRSGERRASICVGWATVANEHAFGSVPGGNVGAHAIVVVVTGKGVYVIEPQSGTIAALRDYPNRDGFEEINL